MKGIETSSFLLVFIGLTRSDHCPAMKGIETLLAPRLAASGRSRSDHCPAMKGIETWGRKPFRAAVPEATTAPQ